jgi:TatD DNase family protein
VEIYPSVFGTQGIHPHNAKDWTTEVKNKILLNLLKNKIIAVGEIGLDYHYSKSPRENQIAAFEEQLQIAVDFKLPVIVHTRDADEDTIAILKNFSPHLKRGGVIHSFTSGLELAKIAIDLNFYIGFNGIITFKNAHNVREALQLTPLENILLETDAPFLTPEPYRGVENAPYYLPFVAKRIADEKNVLVEDLLQHAYQNSKTLFFL